MVGKHDDEDVREDVVDVGQQPVHITLMRCPWRQCVTLFTEELRWLRGRDLELVMGRAVCDWIGRKR